MLGVQVRPRDQLETGSFAPAQGALRPLQSIRVVNWNINRGQQLSAALDFLRDATADVILLQETDVNAQRTQRRNVAREIAQALKMDYVFGREFEELAQGDRNLPAYHGQTTLSRSPLSASRILRFHRQSGFWRPRWFIPRIRPLQRRLGARIALVSHITCFAKPLVVYNIHLESRGDDALRCSQLAEVLEDARQYDSEMPVVIAGDFNLDLLREPAVSIIGRAPFNNPFNSGTARPTTTRSRLSRGRRIDWILTRGPLVCIDPEVHDCVVASDHYPMSVTLVPKQYEALLVIT